MENDQTPIEPGARSCARCLWSEPKEGDDNSSLCHLNPPQMLLLGIAAGLDGRHKPQIAPVVTVTHNTYWCAYFKKCDKD